MPHRETLKTYNILTWKMVHKLLDYLRGNASEDVFTFIYIIAELGGRPSEVGRIRWEDIDFSNSRISLWQSDRRCDYFAVRKLKISSGLNELLQKIRRERPDTRYLFQENGKEKQKPLQKLLNRTNALTAKALGEKILLHDLRKLRAREWYAQGVPLPVLSHWLGHSSIRLTAHFLNRIGLKV
jgi:integrase